MDNPHSFFFPLSLCKITSEMTKNVTILLKRKQTPLKYSWMKIYSWLLNPSKLLSKTLHFYAKSRKLYSSCGGLKPIMTDIPGSLQISWTSPEQIQLYYSTLPILFTWTTVPPFQRSQKQRLRFPRSISNTLVSCSQSLSLQSSLVNLTDLHSAIRTSCL